MKNPFLGDIFHKNRQDKKGRGWEEEIFPCFFWRAGKFSELRKFLGEFIMKSFFKFHLPNMLFKFEEIKGI